MRSATLRPSEPRERSSSRHERLCRPEKAAGAGFTAGEWRALFGVFFLPLLPQFVQSGSDEPARLVGLAGVFGALGLVRLLLVVEIAVRTHAASARPWIGRTVRWAMGVVLIGLGARVALARD